MSLSLFFDYPAELRKVIDTTNAIDSANFSVRKISEPRGLFTAGGAVFKLFSLDAIGRLPWIDLPFSSTNECCAPRV